MLVPGKQFQRRRITLEEFERDHLGSDRDNPKWKAFKATIQPDDEIWEYCSDRQSWDELMGIAGVELIRDGERVATLEHRMN